MRTEQIHLTNIYEFNLNTIHLQKVGNYSKKVRVLETALISIYVKNQTQWSQKYEQLGRQETEWPLQGVSMFVATFLYMENTLLSITSDHRRCMFIVFICTSADWIQLMFNKRNLHNCNYIYLYTQGTNVRKNKLKKFIWHHFLPASDYC